MMRLLSTLACICLVLSGCQEVIRSTPSTMLEGDIYGTLESQPHRLLKGMDHTTGSYAQSAAPNTQDDQSRIDYSSLQDLYVCLSRLSDSAPQSHLLRLTDQAPHPLALALAQGDRLRVINETRQTHTLYLADATASSSGFQALFALSPGATSQEVEILLTGELELGAEEHDNLHIPVLALNNMDCQRLQSGDSYHFTNLTPGTYQVLFWYWRLGAIQHRVVIEAGQSLMVNETLSVDRVFQQRAVP